MTQATCIAKPEWEQHWVRPEAVASVLEHLPLAGLCVLELGAGTGNLTRALLSRGVASVEAWEIDPGIAPVADPRVLWRARDIGLLAPADLAGKALVSFPPYSLLPRIQAALEEARVENAVLMAPKRLLDAFVAQKWRVIHRLRGDAFDPPSSGDHFVIAKGFGEAVFGAVSD